MIDIQKAFDNRWRIKVESANSPLTWVKGVRDLCRDFFETGYILAQREGPPVIQVMGAEKPSSDDEAFNVGFDRWWELYGKKIDRAKCEKKWAKMKDAERRACMAATPAYVDATPDIQFRRHPYTYLNNRSWENQIIPRNADKPTIEQQANKLADILAG